MSECPSAGDAEPSHRNPAGTLWVPVRSGPHGHSVRLYRTPPGGSTAVAFTSRELLRAVLGEHQTWIRLSEPALRALVAPLGATALTVDPRLAAPGPAVTVRAVPPTGPAAAPAPGARPVDPSWHRPVPVAAQAGAA
jgi:hypothetical protein